LFYVIIPPLFLYFLLLCYPYILLHFQERGGAASNSPDSYHTHAWNIMWTLCFMEGSARLVQHQGSPLFSPERDHFTAAHRQAHTWGRTWIYSLWWALVGQGDPL